MLQMKLSGLSGIAPYFYVNGYSLLPTNGETRTWPIDLYISHIGELSSVDLLVTSEESVCISSVYVMYHDTKYTFDSEHYFGSGLILSGACRHSFHSMGDNRPMIQCLSSLKLSRLQFRGIYVTNLHTCVGDREITPTQMKDKTHISIMGHHKGDSSYTTTSLVNLDHVYHGTSTISNVGHLIATNVKLQKSANTTVTSTVAGKMVGIKLQQTVSDEEINGMDMTILIDNQDLFYAKTTWLHWNSLPDTNFFKWFDEDKSLIMFFQNWYYYDITERHKITLSGYDGSGINIYLILKEHEPTYKLPFVVHIKEDWKEIQLNWNGDQDWYDAQEYCRSTYESSLYSITNAKEEFLFRGFTALESAEPYLTNKHPLGGPTGPPGTRTNRSIPTPPHYWLGIVNSTGKWRWVDGYTAFYQNWDTEDVILPYQKMWYR